MVNNSLKKSRANYIFIVYSVQSSTANSNSERQDTSCLGFLLVCSGFKMKLLYSLSEDIT